MSDPHQQAINDEDALCDLRAEWENEQYQLWLDSLTDEEREKHERPLSWCDEL